jgi:hypothetical protein
MWTAPKRSASLRCLADAATQGSCRLLVVVAGRELPRRRTGSDDDLAVVGLDDLLDDPGVAVPGQLVALLGCGVTRHGRSPVWRVPDDQ